MTSDKKHNRGRELAVIVFSFLLAAVFLFYALYGVEFKSVAAILKKASFFWIAVLCFTNLLSHYLRAIRWKVMLNSVKSDVSVTNLFGALMVGYGVNCVIPRLGEISRAVLLGKWEKLSRTAMFGTVIVERVIDMMAFAAALLIGILIWDGNIYKEFPWLRITLYLAAFGLSAFIILLLLVIKFKDRFYRIIVLTAGRISPAVSEKLQHMFEMLVDGFSSLKGTRNYIYTFLFTIAIMVMYAVNSYVGFFTLGIEKISTVTFAMGWVMMAISSIGVVIPTPGGTGSYHTIARSVLVLLFGLSEEISVAYAVLTHIISYVIFITAALFFFFYLNKKYSRGTGRSENLVDFLETNMEKGM